jgi:hypothetical protein
MPGQADRGKAASVRATVSGRPGSARRLAGARNRRDTEPLARGTGKLTTPSNVMNS